jgi:transposase
MSQSLLYHAFGVRRGYDYIRTVYERGSIQFVLAVRPELLVCPQCGSSEVSRKGRRFRDLQTVPIGLKPVFLVTEVPKCDCGRCGHRFEVTPPLPRRMPVTRIGWKRSLATCAAS